MRLPYVPSCESAGDPDESEESEELDDMADGIVDGELGITSRRVAREGRPVVVDVSSGWDCCVSGSFEFEMMSDSCW